MQNFSDHPRVLIVEDSNADMLLMNKRLLTKWSESECVCVGSLAHARAALRASDFDLVLLDLNLPDGLGPRTVAEVRGFNKSIPIVVVTGMATALTVDECLRVGANKVVVKSKIMDDDFMNILEEAL